MAIRYSGDLIIRVLWDDARQCYRASVRGVPGVAGLWRGFIYPAAAMTVAVDSSEAYDTVAHAAISFADDHAGCGDFAEYKPDGTGWAVHRRPRERTSTLVIIDLGPVGPQTSPIPSEEGVN